MAMLWEKKPRANVPENFDSAPEPVLPPETPRMEKPMTDNTQRTVTATGSTDRTTLGRSMVLKGELAGNEDLTIEGQFEGTINVKDHILTVGPQGQVKSEIHARQVIVNGSVNGKISAREKIEIKKTGNVIGDLVSAGVAIEDGAYFKGSIEILREGQRAESPRVQAAAAESKLEPVGSFRDNRIGK